MEHNRPLPDERRLWNSLECTRDGVMFDVTLSSAILKEKNDEGRISYYFPKETEGLAQGKSFPPPAFPALETGLKEIGSRFGDRLHTITDKSLYMDKGIVDLMKGRGYGSCFGVSLSIDLQTSSNYGLFKVFYKEGFNRETIAGWMQYYTDGQHSGHSQFNYIVIPGVVARREITRFGKAVIGGSIFAIGLGLLWRLWPKKS